MTVNKVQYTQKICKWAACVNNAWDSEIVHLAISAFIDTIACIIASSKESSVLKSYNALSGWGSGLAIVVPNRYLDGANRLPAPWAALINGTAAHAQDYDDVLDTALAHVSAVLVPSILAISEEIEASGEACIDAYIVGFEILSKLGEIFNPDHYAKGWHSTITLGSIAAAVSCSRILGLTPTQTRAALSLATSMSSGSKKQFGTMTKHIHAGLAAKNGILAAKLAKEDITATEEIIQGEWSLNELMSGTNEPEKVASIQDLGSPLALLKHGIWQKPYPCCASTHRPIDGLLYLMGKYSFGVGDVLHIESRMAEQYARNLMYENPQNPMEAKFSLQYCLATALLRGTVGPQDFAPEAINRPKIKKLLPIIEKKFESGSAEETKLGDAAITTVVLKNGRKVKTKVAVSLGQKQKPLSDSDLAKKFFECMQMGGYDKGVADCIYRKLNNMNYIDKISNLTKFFE